MAVSTSDKSKPYFALNGIAHDGYSNEHEATATCFCGAVQLAFPVQGEGFYGTFVCHCTDCRKVSASMFATNFTVDDSHIKWIRGKENLKTYSQSHTIAGGKPGTSMTNYFCSICGSLMDRVSSAFPNMNFLRVGSIDDLNLVETKLRPDVEMYTKDRVAWLKPVDGVKQCEVFAYEDQAKREIKGTL